MSDDASLKDRQAESKHHRPVGRPPFDCIALLLQGGGALGSHQAGVYEALFGALPIAVGVTLAGTCGL